MQQFLWQDDLIGVAKFVYACLNRISFRAAGSPNDSQASHQRDVADEM